MTENAANPEKLTTLNNGLGSGHHTLAGDLALGDGIRGSESHDARRRNVRRTVYRADGVTPAQVNEPITPAKAPA